MTVATSILGEIGDEHHLTILEVKQLDTFPYCEPSGKVAKASVGTVTLAYYGRN